MGRACGDKTKLVNSLCIRRDSVKRKTIKASDGMMLTNGEIYALEIDLGDWDSEQNYHEIPIEEYERLTSNEREL